MLFVSLERTESTGQLWLARGTNGRIAGARSVHPKINGSQGDQEMAVNVYEECPGYSIEPMGPEKKATSVPEFTPNHECQESHSKP
ncbi:hypothetical protein ANCDUO_05565 [Ancylostoma duodenale]|uniref:Uncharacterized protein n=1 Tax=Ancylostoma duodenale TaxID=51022 RepID=A0A0C2GS42_9BILA|nr:hypothetical protein ANCDUO_05565 [Ancylostoma duodenale]